MRTRRHEPRTQPSSRRRSTSLDSAQALSEFVTLFNSSVIQQRSRNYHLPALRARVRPEILHTLLGIEIRLARKRLPCPDLATARYLSIFARIGVWRVALPYDITRVSGLADELETILERGLLLATSGEGGKGLSAIRQRKKSFLDRLKRALEGLESKPDYPAFELHRRRANN